MADEKKRDPEMALMYRLRRLLDAVEPATAAKVAAVFDGGEALGTLVLIGHVADILSGTDDEKLRGRVRTWLVNRYEQTLL